MASADNGVADSLSYDNSSQDPEDHQPGQDLFSVEEDVSHERMMAGAGKVESSDTSSSAFSEETGADIDGLAAGGGKVEEEEKNEEEEEEEGECPFCLYMRSGPCGAHFANWEKCVEEAEKGEEDIVTKCWPVTQLLKQCMEANADYYGVILQAEKAMEEQEAKNETTSASKIADEQSTPQVSQQTNVEESRDS